MSDPFEALREFNQVAYQKYADQERVLKEYAPRVNVDLNGVCFKSAVQDAAKLAGSNGRMFMVILPKNILPEQKLASLLQKRVGVDFTALNSQWSELDDFYKREVPYAVADFKFQKFDRIKLQTELDALVEAERRPATYSELLHYLLWFELPPVDTVVFALGSRLAWGIGDRDPRPYFARSKPKKAGKDDLDRFCLGHESLGEQAMRGTQMLLTVSEKGA